MAQAPSYALGHGARMSTLSQATDYTLGNPVAITASASSQRLTLASLGFVSRFAPLTGVMPDYITVHADGADCGVRFGDSTVKVDLSDTSTVVAEAVTDAGATVPHKEIANGLTERWMVPEGATHVAFISSAATGLVRLARASA